MKDRVMGIITTTAILGLPGMILAADRSPWFGRMLREHPVWAWVGGMLLLSVAGVLLGFEKRGYWDGLLIDVTNRKSLSRLVTIVWGTLILSGIATGMAVNVARGCAEPAAGATPPAGSCTVAAWDLHYPEQFLVLVVLLAAIFALASVANNANLHRTLNHKARSIAANAGLLAEAANGDVVSVAPHFFYGVIAGKESAARSSWNDIAKGDVGGHAAYLDLSRVQWLVMSILAAGAYAVFFYRELSDPRGSVMFPAWDAGLNTLLCISAAVYLAVKAANGIAASE